MNIKAPFIWVCTDCARKVGMLTQDLHANAHKNLGYCQACTKFSGMVYLRVADIRRQVKAFGLRNTAIIPGVSLSQVPPKPHFKFTGGEWQACQRTTAALRKAANSRI